MILLFGGTSETAGLATALAHNGHLVLVSTATDAELDVGSHKLIQRRCGRLNEDAIVDLIQQQSVSLIIDASHPYAVELHATVAAAAQRAQIPSFRYQRQAAAIVEEENIYFVSDHHDAAALALTFGDPVLLTTGSRQLAPYIGLHKTHNIPLYARVLPHPESERACDAAELPIESRILGRGPFTEAENRELIHTKHIGVLVTKDSGKKGGVDEKISAARKENCRVIVVRRPLQEYGFTRIFDAVDELVAGVNIFLG